MVKSGGEKSMKNWTFMGYLFGDLMDLMQTSNFMNPYFGVVITPWPGHGNIMYRLHWFVGVTIPQSCIVYAKKHIYIYINAYKDTRISLCVYIYTYIHT